MEKLSEDNNKDLNNLNGIKKLKLKFSQSKRISLGLYGPTNVVGNSEIINNESKRVT